MSSSAPGATARRDEGVDTARGRCAVDDVTLTSPPAVFGIIGYSGGKSTLVRLVNASR